MNVRRFVCLYASGCMSLSFCVVILFNEVCYVGIVVLKSNDYIFGFLLLSANVSVYKHILSLWLVAGYHKK